MRCDCWLWVSGYGHQMAGNGAVVFDAEWSVCPGGWWLRVGEVVSAVEVDVVVVDAASSLPPPQAMAKRSATITIPAKKVLFGTNILCPLRIHN